ncbi:hypothetical protein QNH39_21575 [Neobacillus novalis]|uniref:Uncharacterized protein n=1 Tax=Neobacillus novalis TaxID=220687 RepID=A0AA95SAA8_9BACI|nr:hypothetical protein [Neobacillus novalis]WHY85184.1 hypothetical protein QNH39_21575 [Neobacillus novalis]
MGNFKFCYLIDYYVYEYGLQFNLISFYDKIKSTLLIRMLERRPIGDFYPIVT